MNKQDLAVACPTCGADVDQLCRPKKPRKKPSTNPYVHAARLRANHFGRGDQIPAGIPIDHLIQSSMLTRR